MKLQIYGRDPDHIVRTVRLDLRPAPGIDEAVDLVSVTSDGLVLSRIATVTRSGLHVLPDAAFGLRGIDTDQKGRIHVWPMA